MGFKRRSPLLVIGCSVGIILFLRQNLRATSYSGGDLSVEEGSPYLGRRLLADNGSDEDCVCPAVTQFPRDVFTDAQLDYGAVLLHCVCAVYMFIALAIVCDDYFVPSLEGICDLLHMSPDVAGATFMAAGSSAPELATAVIGIFVTQDDIGLSAVVGSAVFNIMFVIGICGVFVKGSLDLNWYPMLRDCVCYALSIGALVWAIADNKIELYESIVLLVLYLLYIVLMYFNPFLSRVITGLPPCRGKGDEYDSLITEPSAPGETDAIVYYTTDDEKADVRSFYSSTASLASRSRREGDVDVCRSIRSLGASQYSLLSGKGDQDEDEENSVLTPPKGVFSLVFWVLCLPLNILMVFTVPDCRKPRWKRWFMITFITSCIWITAFSYLLVWMITVIGHTWNISDDIMSISFLAAGVSIPDAIASLIVVRDGLGDMAVANAIGSNVFDILLCLGLPWFIKILTSGAPVDVHSKGLFYLTIILFSTVVLLVLATAINKWRLTRGYGVLLLIIYVVFMVIAVLYELNIFIQVTSPVCPVVGGNSAQALLATKAGLPRIAQWEQGMHLVSPMSMMVLPPEAASGFPLQQPLTSGC